MLLLIFRMLSALPLRLMQAGGSVLGWCVNRLSSPYRQRLQQHITQAGFGQVHGLAVREAGKAIAELPFAWFASPRRLERAVQFSGWEAVQTALAARRGVILLTPHLGCFEISAQAVARRTPFTVLYRPPRKAVLQPLLEQARQREGLTLAPAQLSGVRLLLKALKQGQAIGLLPDQVPQQGEGVWADFFGRPAYTMTLPARLHQMTGAPIFLAYVERLARGAGYHVHISEFTGLLEGTAAQQARTLNAAMEDLIGHCPAQYFWSYNRYKTPAGVAPPGEQT